MRMPSCFLNWSQHNLWNLPDWNTDNFMTYDWDKNGWMWLELSHPHCHGMSQNLCGWWIPTKPIGSSCHQQIWLNHTYSIKPFQRWSFCTFCFVAIWIGTCVKPKALWWCEQWSQIFTQWLSGPRKCIQQISERTVGSKTNTQHLGQQIINIFALLTTKSDADRYKGIVTAALRRAQNTSKADQWNHGSAVQFMVRGLSSFCSAELGSRWVPLVGSTTNSMDHRNRGKDGRSRAEPLWPAPVSPQMRQRWRSSGDFPKMSQPTAIATRIDGD